MESRIDGLEPVNLGNPNEMTVNELLEQVIALTRVNPRVEYRPLPTDDPRRRKPDIGRARAMLGWEPKVDLRTGLAKTCAWFAEELRGTAAADDLVCEAAE
jgi:UDP-glucuronate decarboxylase